MAYDIANEEAGRELAEEYFHDKLIFFKVAQADFPQSYFISPIQDMQGLLESMMENVIDTEENESYIISTVVMTQAEYDQLPEFKGF